MGTDAPIPAWDTAALANQLQVITSQSQQLMQSFLDERRNWDAKLAFRDK